ncbi:CDP-glucose 4,6-dehydratase [Candidatus Pelagibacter sp. HIMB1611]|uniref:CDP-glucose 4,6-dehydratase n=1 Tax=unclassified Candidatus Pelagibacter TaxID=2647897 RepID=UPI003F833440
MKNFFTNKKILITGHTGFKGTWLCQILLLFEARILGISKDKFDERLFKSLNIHNRIHKSLKIDLTNYAKSKKEILKFKPDIVFHLAAQSLVIPSLIEPKKTLDNNLNSSINIFEILEKTKTVKSFICVTSDKCYEISKSKKNFKENDKLGGSDPYSISKACTELIFNYYKNEAIKLKIGYASVRAGNIIGGGDFTKFRLIPDIIKANQNKKEIVLRDPNNIRPWQHVIDCLFGYLTLSKKIYENPRKYSGSWNFGPKKIGMKAIELANLIKKNKNFKSLKIKVIKNKYKETNFLSLNTNKSNKILKFENKILTNEMIRVTLSWYKKYYSSRKEIIFFSDTQILNYISKTNRYLK